MTDDEHGGVPHLAERLNALFERIPQGAGSSQLYGNTSAAKALAEHHGVQVTPNHLSLMRSGRRNNPSARLLAAIAEMFDVPYAYFFDTELADKIISDLDLLAGMRDTQVRAILARAAGLNDRGTTDLAAILRQIQQLEGTTNDGDPRP